MRRKRKRPTTTKPSGGVLAAMRRKSPKPGRPILSLVIIGILLIGWIIVRDEPVTTPADADVVVYVASSCKCYQPWIQQLRRDGLAVSALQTHDIVRKQASLGVPREFSACHTAVANGYWLEGHLPAASIAALTAEAPEEVSGIAHLRANVDTSEGVAWEVVSYDTSGEPISSAPDHQHANGNERELTHERP